MPGNMPACLPPVLAFLAMASAPAQSVQTPQTVNLSGTVIDSVTGQGLRRALVKLNGQRFAFTAADGRFQFEQIPAGEYVISAEKPGYFDPHAGPGGIMRPVSIASGSPPIALTLLPAASITGRVLDASGEPVSGADVEATSSIIANGRRSWGIQNHGQTGEDGAYELSGLMPGTYRLRLNQMRVPPFDLPMHAAGRLPTELYPLQFYPNASDEAAAQSIQLEPGRHAEADFTVSAVPGFAVGGTLSGCLTGCMLTLETPAGIQIASFGWGVNTRWHLRAVPAGSWKIVAQEMDGPGGQLSYGEQSFDIRSNALQNVNIVMQPLPDIPVRITGPDSSASNFAQISLSSSNNSYSSNAAAGPENGGARIQRVLPGVYRVSASATAGNVCIDTVMSGNTDLSRDDLTVSAGVAPVPIDVSLRSDCASVSVAVNLPASSASASILLISSNRLFEPRIMEITASASAELANIPPGEYRVYAFSSVDDLEYANPEALREYSGQSITLAPNENAHIKVEFIQRGH